MFAEYKEKLQDERCVVWKRLQPQVREMCDVCSTSLFNAHFTCTECGIIVCFDCHQVRLKGNLAYKGSSVTYKSKRKKINPNVDAHYWPFCKEDRTEHQPAKFVLTQIICGDILEDMNAKVHEVKKRLNMKLDCHCCAEVNMDPVPALTNLSSDDEIMEEKEPQKKPEKVKEKVEKTIEKKDELIEKSNKFIENLKNCPVCQYKFNPDRTLSVGVHLVNHFKEALSNSLTDDNKPFKCSECHHESSDKMAFMLHTGIVHGEIEKQIEIWLKKKYSLKNVVLKADAEKICRVCDMDYNVHMMGKPQIRTHLYTHFREDILQMVIKNEQEDFFRCPKCDFTDGAKYKSNFVTHLGVWHQELDNLLSKFELKTEAPKINLLSKFELKTETPKNNLLSKTEAPKKKMSLSDYKNKKKSLSPESNYMPTEIDEKSEELPVDEESGNGNVKSGNGNVQSGNGNVENGTGNVKNGNGNVESGNENVKSGNGNSDLTENFSCPVCDLPGPKAEIMRHCVEHYLDQLKDMVKLGLQNDQACDNCPAEFDIYHLALEHNHLEILISDITMLEMKRSDFQERTKRKRRSSIDLTMNKRPKGESFKCGLCNIELSKFPQKDIIDHFSTHLWIRLQQTKPIHNKDDFFNSFFSLIPMESWIEYQGWTRKQEEAVALMQKVHDRVSMIIEGQWCPICLKSYQEGQKVQHDCHNKKSNSDHAEYLTKKLSSEDDVEKLRSIISPVKNSSKNKAENQYCEWCIEGYKPEDKYEHLALEHFKNLFLEVIVPENTTGNNCNLCTFFLAKNTNDLILHLARHHRLLERYIYLINNGEICTQNLQTASILLIQITS